MNTKVSKIDNMFLRQCGLTLVSKRDFHQIVVELQLLSSVNHIPETNAAVRI